MKGKLKPCPFCGSKDVTVLKRITKTERQVVCHECGASTLWGVDAEEKWRRRIPAHKNLKPCPLCGRKGKVYEFYDGTQGVQCTGCGLAAKKFRDTNTAIAAWNRRPLHD